MSWSTSELRVRLAPLNRFKPSSKIFYWPFQGGTSFVDLLCFCSVLCLLCFVHVCLYGLCGHLLGKGSRLWCLLWVCHFPIGILGQVWYLIVSIPDLCTITYLSLSFSCCVCEYFFVCQFLSASWLSVSCLSVSCRTTFWSAYGHRRWFVTWLTCTHLNCVSSYWRCTFYRNKGPEISLIKWQLCLL